MFSKLPRSARSWAIPAAIFALLAPPAVGVAQAFFSNPPADLDLGRSKSTAHGLYRSAIAPSINPVAVRQMHSWTILLTTAKGEPVEQARITVSGGMPQHGHGLPTKPVVTPQSAGRYVIDGVKFNMGGWWTLTLHIDAAAGADDVTYNLSL